MLRMMGDVLFGYVKPRIPDLRVGEYELYRAVYCGLCRAMGSVTGQLSRLTLSYDYCFLALVRLALAGEDTAVFARHRCFAHPVKPRLMAEDHPALRYTASAAACLLEGKRADDRTDERGPALLKPVLLTPLTRSMVQKGVRVLPETLPLSRSIPEGLAVLSALEKENCDSPDRAAQAFGEVLGTVFAHGLTGSDAAVSHAIGVGTGRFLYLCDALDDLPEDVRRGRYNPFALLWGDMALDSEGKAAPPVKKAFATAARIDLEKLALATELLPGGKLTEICRNIVYLGMPDTIDSLTKA